MTTDDGTAGAATTDSKNFQIEERTFDDGQVIKLSKFLNSNKQPAASSSAPQRQAAQPETDQASTLSGSNQDHQEKELSQQGQPVEQTFGNNLKKREEFETLPTLSPSSLLQQTQQAPEANILDDPLLAENKDAEDDSTLNELSGLIADYLLDEVQKEWAALPQLAPQLRQYLERQNIPIHQAQSNCPSAPALSTAALSSAALPLTIPDAPPLGRLALNPLPLLCRPQLL